MLDDLIFVVTLVSALGCGMVGGVFFAFSSFVMKGLARLQPSHGIAAMQSINVAVLNSWFLTPFLGTAVACILLIVAALLGWGDASPVLLLAGSALYLAGSMAVTIACNVPRNDALAAVDPDSADGALRWERFIPGWTAWNTVRAVAALAAAAAFIVALVAG
jgi:uncharacterized membrane protein